MQDLTERLILFLKKIPENDTLYMDMCDLVDGIKEDEKMKYFRRRLYDVLNVLEGIQYKLIARVVRKHSGKINCLGSVAKKILVKIRNDVKCYKKQR